MCVHVHVRVCVCVNVHVCLSVCVRAHVCGTEQCLLVEL